MELKVTENPTQEGSDLSLKDQLIQKREQKGENLKDAFQEQEADEVHVRQDARNRKQVGERSENEKDTYDSEEEYEESVNKLRFRKGDESFEVDEDALFELKADGINRKVTLKELRDYAAGGIAVRNRMRQLAEERKKIQDPFKDFSKVSKNDPLGSLKKVFSAIKEVDPNADLKGFLRDLGNQVQQQAKMTPAERRNYELENELREKENALTDTQRLQMIKEFENEIMETYQIDQDRIAQYGDAILSDPELSKKIRNEKDLFDRIGLLADEVDRQQAVISALGKVDKRIKPHDPLVLELSEVLRQNPDFDEDDLQDIAHQIVNGVEKNRASQKLSKRQRSRAISRRDSSTPDYSRMKPAEALKHQLLEKRKKQQEANRR